MREELEAGQKKKQRNREAAEEEGRRSRDTESKETEGGTSYTLEEVH